VGNFLNNAAAGTIIYPTLAATAAAQLYTGYGSTSIAGTGGGAGSTTGGWVWQTDGYACELVYNLSIGPGSVTPPNATNNPSSETSNSLGAIIADQAVVASNPRGGFFPFMGHHEEFVPGELWTPDRKIHRPSKRDRRIIDLVAA
jgi:hypothetical protein